MKKDKIILICVFIFISAFYFISCGNSGWDEILDKECISNSDCPDGYFCDTVTEKCAKSSNNDGSGGLPDNGGLPGDDSSDISDDDNGTAPKGDVKCDCFGTEYTIPGKFENIQGWCKADADGDGIPNCIEVANGIEVDTEEDGTSDYLDTDSDGDSISDSTECTDIPCRDTDSDGVPDYRDDDSDGDALLDNVECFSDPCIDSDSDGTPDYIDTDSDDDGVPDVYETAKDTDKDGMPNFLDDDSDGDGISDSDECPSLPCADSDGDGIYDFLDLDSDGDGLPDNQEVDCPNLGIHSRTKADTDDDGFSDLAEILTGSDPCDSANGVFDTGVKFYFELPYQGEEKDDILTFAPQVKMADIFFNVDTTYSMSGAITNLKSSLSSVIIPGVRNKITNSAFGVSYFDDFPVSNYGTGSDRPFGLLQSPTTDTATAQAGVDKLALHNGNDVPESGYESLYRIATGVELRWNGGSVPAGNVGFRAGSIPIVVHITDAVAHTTGQTPYSSSYVYTIFSHDQTVTALNSIGAKVVTVHNGSVAAAITQLSNISNGTGAIVPSCANAGRTTLLYQISSNGTGLDTSTVNGIDALIKFATFSVYVVPADDGDGGTIDTACFLKKIEAIEYVPVDSCAATITATPGAFNGSSYNNGFSNFSTGTSSATNPGNQLKFKVVAQNDTCFESTGAAKMFKAFINVIDNATGSVLDTQEVTIIVPGKVSGSDA